MIRLTGILLLIAVDFSLGADAPQPQSPPLLLQDGLLAFDRPTMSELRDSPKKVFAHYFTQFPLSIDLRPLRPGQATRALPTRQGQ